VRVGQRRQQGAVPGGQLAIGPQQQVGAAVEQVHHGRPVPPQAGQTLQHRAKRLDQRKQGRVQDRAGVHVHDVAGPAAVQADADGGTVAADGQVHAPPRFGRGAGQIRHRHRRSPHAAQRVRDLPGLPRGVAAVAPVLQRASAAGTEMRAGRDNAIRRGFQEGGTCRPTLAAPG